MWEQAWPKLARIWPQCGPNRPNLDGICQQLPNITKFRLTLDARRPNRSTIGRQLVDLDKCWQSSPQRWSRLAQFVLNLAALGHVLTQNDQYRTNVFEICRNLTKFGQMPTKCGRFAPGGRRFAGQAWSDFGRCCPRLVDADQSPAKLGKIPAKFGHHSPTMANIGRSRPTLGQHW